MNTQILVSILIVLIILIMFYHGCNSTTVRNNTNPITGEINGPKGKEPTRYGDWERNGRVYDFW